LSNKNVSRATNEGQSRTQNKNVSNNTQPEDKRDICYKFSPLHLSSPRTLYRAIYSATKQFREDLIPCYERKPIQWVLALEPENIKKAESKDGTKFLNLTFYNSKEAEQVGDDEDDKIDPYVACSVLLADYPELMFTKKTIPVKVIGTITKIGGINTITSYQRIEVSDVKLDLPSSLRKKIE